MITGGDFEPANLRKAPAERMAGAVLPVSALTWAAAEVMHVTGQPGTFASAATGAALAAVAWGASVKHEGLGWLPWWAGAGAVLLASADTLGPLAWWPAPVLTAAWAAAALAARRKAFAHDAVTSARERRDARADWLERRHRWGLDGSHLLDFERTRLGELYTVDVKGTGKRRSQILASPVAEVIAQAEDLDESRVRLMRHGPAGRVRVSIRRVNPWADPILHPLACEEHEITLPEYRSILDPAVIGQDPETGEPLTVPLCAREFGANRVSVVANTGGGKGVLEDNLFEHVTACEDALAVHLNVSEKGYEDEESWGPACWLTAYGPEQKSRAAAILKVIAAVIEWRTRNFKRGQYAPSPGHPAIIIFYDESDAGLSALREGLNTMATKGRSHGVGLVRLSQRNTREYADPKARSQDNVRCTGLVQNSNEARHAGSGTGPDMSTYGEGKPGVWKVEVLGASMHLGRTWVFHETAAGHGAAVERIAQDRAFSQPELAGACRDYLGAPYEALLATEVFARWARARGDGPDAPDTEDEAPAAGPPEAAAPGPRQRDETAPAAVAPAGKTALAEGDPFEKWLEMDVDADPDTDARSAAIREKLAGARHVLTETPALPRTAPADREERAARADGRWRELGERTVIPGHVRPRLLEMLAGGTTIRAVTGAFPQETGGRPWTARKWLARLGYEGLADVAGDGRARQWRLAPPPEGGEDGDAR